MSKMIKKKLIAQTYDGAAVMSGSSNGVQAIVNKLMNTLPTYIVKHIS
jgi:hypothetical protein